MKLPCLLSIAMLGAALISSPANAGIQIMGTRVVYLSGEREVTVDLINSGKSPRLVQAWVDGGDATETAQTSKAPFVITPPMSRIDPAEGQSLRLMFTGTQSIPQDRESLFWLNVLEVPPKPAAGEDAQKSYLQFAVRTRIKLFYRPEGLVGDPVSAVDGLSWQLVRGSKDARLMAECINPTPFNVSISTVSLAPLGVQKDLSNGDTCPARGRVRFPVDQQAAGGRVYFKTIDDLGATRNRESPIS